MQADILHELTPECPVTTNLRALIHRFDHFDLAETLDFVSIESTAAIKANPAKKAGEFNLSGRSKKEASGHPTATPAFGSLSRRLGTSVGRMSIRWFGPACCACSPTSWCPAERRPF